ncbi:MAG: fumarylacetoacetate hydrolase family protein [Candidatus Omnitrophica bacterium]|nr:fumarylacetoacetate hydrolase family protein [Candidatus Omnitrophota bacterium]
MKNKFAKVYYKDKAIWCKVIDEKYYELKNSIFEDNALIKDAPIEAKEFKLLPPCDATKVIALAYNYKGLIGEKTSHDEPLFFFKSLTGLIGDGESVIYPDFAKKVWHEAELAIVIKKKGKHIPVQEAEDYILGYTCGNDITCLNILNRDWHLARSKGLDTFCPLGPFLIKDIDTSRLQLKSFINENVTQNSNTSDRILSDKETVSLVSRFVTLFPGDVILTGTPAGATDAIIKPGDEIKVEIESIGILKNYVKKERKI